MKKNYDNIENLENILDSLGDIIIPVQPIYIRITGSLKSSVLLSRIICLIKNMKVKEFCKIDAELMEEIGLTKAELKNAKSILKKLNLINVSKKGIPQKCFYSINFEELNNKLKKARR